MLPLEPRPSGPPGATTLARVPRWTATAVLLVWALATAFLRVGAAPVYILNEAREGVYARAMLESGNFVLPAVPSHVENGETIPDKPPLVHWLSADVTALRVWAADGHLPAGPALAARYDEWSLRFPSALAAVLTIAAIALLGRHLVGDRAALLAGATLLASWQFVHQARFGRVDMALCACVTLTMLLAGRALLDGVPRALILAAVAAAFAVLAKGPLGIGLPLAACATFVAIQSVRQQSLAGWRHLPWRRAGLVWALLTLPWYLAAIAVGGMAVVHSQILGETLQQFSGANAQMRVLYYLGPWFTDSAPWNLLGALGAWRAWRTRDPRAGFCAVWWGCFLAVFQLSAYKRRAYLLPALPAGALLAGYWMDRWLGARDASLRAAVQAAVPAWWRRALVASLAVAAAGSVAVRAATADRWLGTALPAVDGALAFGGAALGSAALIALCRALKHRQPAGALAALCAAQTAVYLGPVAAGELVVAQRHSPIPLVRRLIADTPAGERVTALGLGDDASLLILFYFPDLARLDIVAQRDGIPTTLPAGYYVLADPVWKQLGAAGDRRAAHGWRTLWTDTLRERNATVPFVFAERVD